MDEVDAPDGLTPREELERLLDEDEGRIGDVYRLTRGALGRWKLLND